MPLKEPAIEIQERFISKEELEIQKTFKEKTEKGFRDKEEVREHPKWIDNFRRSLTTKKGRRRKRPREVMDKEKTRTERDPLPVDKLRRKKNC